MLGGSGTQLKNRGITVTHALSDYPFTLISIPVKDERKISPISFNDIGKEYASINSNGSWQAKFTVGASKDQADIEIADNSELRLILAARLEVLSAADQSDSGERFLKESKFDKAIIAFQKAVELEPNNAGYVNALAWSQFRTNDYQEALKNARLAVHLKPDNPDYYHTLAHAAYANEYWKESSAAWDQVLQLKKDYFEIRRSSPCQDDKMTIKETKDRPASRDRLAGTALVAEPRIC